MRVSDARPSRHREVERKFEVADGVDPPSFGGIQDLVVAAEPVSQALDALYFDTPRQDLLAHRITLRRRAGGTDSGWQLKLPAGPDARTEVRAPLGGDTAPAELRDVVLAVVRDRPLTPVAQITTSRAVTLLRDADGAALAEFCDDRVTAVNLLDGAEQRWREWEIELVGGDSVLLDQLSDRLLGADALPSGHGSKLARALGSAPSNVVQLDPVHRAVAEQVAELLVWDRAVRADADDAVHQMRVIIRKIRSLLQVSGLSDDAVSDELRWLAGLLGVARDAEVLGQRYRQALDRLPPQLVRGPVAERLVGGAAQRYQAGLCTSLTAMRSARYFRLLDRLDVLTAEHPAVEHASTSIDAAYRRVQKAAKAARTASATGCDEALHRIRKAAKRLRYAAAATDEPEVAERAKAIQALLGDHQDSVVSRARLLAEATAAHAAGADTFSYGLLYQREEDLADRCRAKLDSALERLAEAMGGRVGL